MLAEIRKQEKKMMIEPDWAVDAFQEVINLMHCPPAQLHSKSCLTSHNTIRSIVDS